MTSLALLALTGAGTVALVPLFADTRRPLAAVADGRVAH
jgi:hypothetical protein